MSAVRGRLSSVESLPSNQQAMSSAEEVRISSLVGS